MIYDPHSSALFADDGTFLHTVYCPMALTPDQLDAIYTDSLDRQCSQCDRRIHSLDGLTDAQAKILFRDDPRACVFSTGNARNIVFLHHREQHEGNSDGLPVIRTARNLQMMQAARQQGFKLLLREVGVAPQEGEFKYIVYQHRETGEIWWSGDLRSQHPLDYPIVSHENLLTRVKGWLLGGKKHQNFSRTRDPWILVKNWFHAQADQPFPLAAYLIPKDLPADTAVFIEDVIENQRELTWNQGNSRRIHASKGHWTGKELNLDDPSADDSSPPARMVG